MVWGKPLEVNRDKVSNQVRNDNYDRFEFLGELFLWFIKREISVGCIRSSKTVSEIIIIDGQIC